MALTRKALNAMGIESEKIEQIIELHTETVDGLKKQADDLREQAEKVPTLEAKVEELEAAKPTKDWEAEYNGLSEQFEAYKSQVAAERAEEEKARLYRALLRDAGIDEKRLDAIMKVTDLSGVSVEDGAIAGAEELKASAAEEWAAFIPQIEQHGTNPATPPQTTPNDHGANPDVVKRLQERHERMYGKSETTE